MLFVYSKLSALLSVSSFTEHISNGNRQNCGVIEKNKSRLSKEKGHCGGHYRCPFNQARCYMEFQDIITAKQQNTTENGYGLAIDADTMDSKQKDYRRVWKQFYEEPDFL